VSWDFDLLQTAVIYNCQTIFLKTTIPTYCRKYSSLQIWRQAFIYYFFIIIWTDEKSTDLTSHPSPSHADESVFILQYADRRSPGSGKHLIFDDIKSCSFPSSCCSSKYSSMYDGKFPGYVKSVPKESHRSLTCVPNFLLRFSAKINPKLLYCRNIWTYVCMNLRVFTLRNIYVALLLFYIQSIETKTEMGKKYTTKRRLQTIIRFFQETKTIRCTSTDRKRN